MVLHRPVECTALIGHLTGAINCIQADAVKKKVILAVGSAIVLALIYFALCGVRTSPTESLRRQIEQSVKVGCAPDEVIQFLNSQHLEHSSLIRLNDLESLHRTYGDALLVVARKRRTFQVWWGFESIQIVFVFDEGNRLIRFDLRPEYTAL
jgi:hypothetical protein